MLILFDLFILRVSLLCRLLKFILYVISNYAQIYWRFLGCKPVLLLIQRKSTINLDKQMPDSVQSTLPLGKWPPVAVACQLSFLIFSLDVTAIYFS